MDQIVGNANVGHLHLSGAGAALSQVQAGLGAGEGDGDLGPDRLTQNLSGVPVHPRRDVAGYHRAGPVVHDPDGGQKGSGHRPSQPDAEQSVHHAVAGGQPHILPGFLGAEGLQLAYGSDEFFLHGFGIRRHFIPVPHQEGPDLIAHAPQQPGGGHAVAPVVAGTAEHRHPRGRIGVFGLHKGAQLVHLPPLCLGGRLFPGAHDQAEGLGKRPPVFFGTQYIPHRLRHRLGGPLHQVQGGNPPLLDGDAVQFPHLPGAG